jgi:signal transduction histidine kinase
MPFNQLGIVNCGDATMAFLGLFDFSIAPPLLYYSYLPIVAGTLLISTFIFINNSKLLQARLLFVVASFFVLWVANILLQWIAVPAPIVMYAWELTAVFEVGLFAASFYFAYAYFFKRFPSIWVNLVTFTAFLGLAVLLPTQLNVESFDFNNCQANLGVLWDGLYALQPAVIILIGLLGIHAYRKESDRSYRKQIALLAAGMVVFLGIFSASNYYGEITKFYEFNFLGPVGMFLFIVLLGYLVVQYGAFNVKLIATQALVAATLLITGSQFFFVQNSVNYWLVSLTFVLTACFGYLIVRSVKREIEQRERIEVLAKDLERANTQQATLIRFITHQLKGFMSKSRNIFAMIQEGDFGPVPEPMQPLISEGFTSSTKGAQTIQEILNASNIKSGKMAYDKKAMDLAELVRSVVAVLVPNAHAKGLQLTLAGSDEPLTIMGDRMQLDNALRNLIDNSIKYTPQGSVSITLDRGPQANRLTITDTGVGITPEDMANLFTEGGHGKESQKVNVDSTGFGLYIVKNIIEAHDGKVWAESDGAGKGSRFIVELPAA